MGEAEILRGVQQLIKEKGRKVRVAEYESFRKIHHGFADTATLMRRYKSWTAVLDAACSGPDSPLLEVPEPKEWNPLQVIQAVCTWLESKPSTTDRYSYRQMLRKDRRNRYPDLHTISDQVDPNFETVIALVKSYLKAKRTKGIQTWNLNRELENLRAQLSVGSPEGGRSVEDASRRLRSIFEPGPEL